MSTNTFLVNRKFLY